jgi:sulfur transfer protein SufE
VSAVSEAQERGLSTRVEDVVSKFQACTDAKERYQLVMQYAQALPAYPAEVRQNANRVLGCTAQVRPVTHRLSSWSAIVTAAKVTAEFLATQQRLDGSGALHDTTT